MPTGPLLNEPQVRTRADAERRDETLVRADSWLMAASYPDTLTNPGRRRSHNKARQMSVYDGICAFPGCRTYGRRRDIPPSIS